MQAIAGGAESKILDPGFAVEDDGFWLEHAQLLTKRQDFKARVIAGAEECGEASEESG